MDTATIYKIGDKFDCRFDSQALPNGTIVYTIISNDPKGGLVHNSKIPIGDLSDTDRYNYRVQVEYAKIVLSDKWESDWLAYEKAREIVDERVYEEKHKKQINAMKSLYDALGNIDEMNRLASELKRVNGGEYPK